jgi:hypothetical protein
VIVELAIATGIAPAMWWAEDDQTIVTALDVLEKQAERIEQAKRR